MKIAIHDRPGSFSDRWIAYCEEKNIPYKKVNCYSNDIIQQIHDCDALMFHHNQAIIKEVIFAKQLLFALKDSGIKLFPDFYTNWHFDDKVGQKYLFESLELPLVPSDRKSTRLNSSHVKISYAVFCLKKKNTYEFN